MGLGHSFSNIFSPRFLLISFLFSFYLCGLYSFISSLKCLPEIPFVPATQDGSIVLTELPFPKKQNSLETGVSRSECLILYSSPARARIQRVWIRWSNYRSQLCWNITSFSNAVLILTSIKIFLKTVLTSHKPHNSSAHYPHNSVPVINWKWKDKFTNN